jgi:ubiquinone/menaquinone biosynthesis C-methylase UbiE
MRKQHPAVEGDAEDLPFGTNRFDTVVMLEVLEHVSDPVATLAEVARVLHSGGVLLLSTPNAEISLIERLYHCVRHRVWPRRSNLQAWDPLHARRLSVRELVSYLDEAGFEIIALRPWARSGFAFGYYFVDAVGRRLGLPTTTAWFTRLDTFFPRDQAANIVVVAQTSRPLV